ncbi:MAG: class I adenylate-forming enzyme family protein [Kordiimonas sp.]
MTFFDTSAPLLPEILSLHGKWKGNKTALIFGEERISWKELDEATNQIANGLIENGVSTGDMVGVVMKNGRQMVETLIGIMKSGAASVPINLSVSDDAMMAMLDDAAVSAVIVTVEQSSRLISYDGSKLKLAPIIAAGASSDDFETFKGKYQPTKPTAPIADDSPLNVIYSSGTTGTPKGILHTHKGRRDWAYDLSIALRYDGSAKTLFTIGLYSNISWVGFLSTLLVGGTLVIHEAFDTQHALETIEAESITNFSMVPIQYQRLLEDADNEQYDLSSLKAVMSCGSPLHSDLREKLFNRLGPVVIELFGLTEGVITTLEPEEAQGRMASAGKPLVGTDLMIINEEGTEVAAGISGEVVACGRVVMPGYLNRPDATKEAVYTDSNGKNWIRTGDIGKLDEEGYLFIVDRKKDMILSGGQNIYPQDIEAVLVSHPSINEAAVIGAKSTTWGETPFAIIAAEAGRTLDVRDIKTWANSKLGKQQRIAGLTIIEQLPRNPNGKILKKDLRKTFEDVEFD